jgi:alpha-N-arabinofuranosidase
MGWNRTVLEKLKDQIDYLSLHMYVPPRREKTLEDFLSGSRTLDERLEIAQAQIRAAQSGMVKPRPIAIAFDEWNVCCRTSPGNELEVHRTGLEERYRFDDALAMGMFLNSFLRHAGIVKMANLAQLVNALAPIVTSHSGLFRQSIFFPIEEYGKQRGNLSLDVLVSSPETQKSSGQPLPVLDVSASWNSRTRRLSLNVLNRSAEDDVTTRVDCVEGRLGDKVEVWQMSHPDMLATHDFGRDRLLTPKTSTLAVSPNAKTFNYKFPKASLTILKFAL